MHLQRGYGLQILLVLNQQAKWPEFDDKPWVLHVIYILGLNEANNRDKIFNLENKNVMKSSSK